MVDVGLYVHVPFCPRKCGYCDFFSVVPAGDEADSFVDVALAELGAAVVEADVRVETIFVGGGTPTALPTPALARLMEGLAAVAGADAPVEFSVEANPGSLTQEKAALLRGCGVNRISMGAQSFEPGELAVLERIHTPADIVAGADIVARAGFAHFNLDLIFGIPGQTLASWEYSLARAIELGPDHLACYGLTYEPGTPLEAAARAGKVVPVGEELEAEMYLVTMDRLPGLGFEQYELSNYARAGGRCRHNLRYWRNRSGIGIGPGAASYLAGWRWRNLPDLAGYVEGIRAGRDVRIDREHLSARASAGETAMLGLRLAEGLGIREFRHQTGFGVRELFGEAIDRHAQTGLLRVEDDRIALTRRGRLVADVVMADFLAAAGPDQP